MIILKIIGVLLLIILILLVIALCIPVCIGIKYDDTVTLTVKYLFVRVIKEFGGEQASEAEYVDKEPAVFDKILKKVSEFFKRSWSAIKNGCKKAAGFIKRNYRRLRSIIKAKFKTRSKSRKSRKKKGSGRGKSAKIKTSEQSLFGSLREERGFWGAIEFFVDLGKMFGGGLIKIYRGIAANKFVLRAEITGEDAADTAIKYGRICSAAFPMLSILLSNMRRYSQDIEITPNFDGEEGRIYFDGEFVAFPIIVICHALGAVIKFAWKQIKITLKNQMKK